MNLGKKKIDDEMEEDLHFRACYDELADCGGVVSRECPWRATFAEATVELESLKLAECGMVPNYFVQAEEASKAPLGS